MQCSLMAMRIVTADITSWSNKPYMIIVPKTLSFKMFFCILYLSVFFNLFLDAISKKFFF